MTANTLCRPHECDHDGYPHRPIEARKCWGHDMVNYNIIGETQYEVFDHLATALMRGTIPRNSIHGVNVNYTEEESWSLSVFYDEKGM